MNPSSHRRSSYRRLTALAVLFALGIFTWKLASKPVLLHTHALTNKDSQFCGEYNEEATGITILNPIRSRFQERVADAFLRAASNGECSPDVSEALCRFVTAGHSVPAREWRLVNRRDSSGNITLFYRLIGASEELQRHNGCEVARVDLEQTDATWKIVGYGLTAGPYKGK
jgi:hypothetical protein